MSARVFSVPVTAVFPPSEAGGAGEHLTRLFGPPSAFVGEVQGLLLDDGCDYKVCNHK